MRRFWEVEELPRKSVLSAEDEKCEEHFKSTHSRSEDGRYIVRLPFKHGPPIEIGNSRCKAERLLTSLTRRLNSNTEHLVEYTQFLDEYERLGHMRQAPILSDFHEQRVYIPHHPVFRDDSLTSHLRVVFNASSVTTNGSSLNDHLLAGPKLQTDLSAIILQWRRFKFVYTADIAKMFRQIRLDSRDINYQRILWKSARRDEPVEFQLLTVTYGMACAPFLALRVLKQLAEDEGAQYPKAVPILHDNIYVDDLLFGDDDDKSLIQIRDQLIMLLRRGGFELRKWASNSFHLLSNIDAADHGLACTRSLAADEKLKILGIGWNPSLDAFQMQVSLDGDVPVSKRTILSAIAKIYDPLGWVTPVTIAAKILMQQLWREKLGWDDVVPETLLRRWTLIYSRFSSLKGVLIPRWVALGPDIIHSELHGFADASNLAYSAVVYLKTENNLGEVKITLLAGKSKVAPLTPLSIPRLELSAAVLLSRLLEFVRKSLKAEAIPCFCWSDSTVVLAWLKQHPSRWKTFVANRVADVQSRLPKCEWRYVCTDNNSADCASRGLLGDELLAHSLWWHGPSWLRLPQEEWPTWQPCLHADASHEEKKVVVHHAQPIETYDIAARFSSWPKLLRVTAYIFRFASRCRRVNTASQSFGFPSRALTADECRFAKVFWIKHIQSAIFAQEIQTLSANRTLSAKSAILALSPFLDQNGILRVGGRLRNAPIPFSTKHPILLASHPLVKLIVEQAHIRALHAGLQLTLSTLRTDFWIIRARSIVKSIIHRCVTCAREQASVPSQLMGDLPSVRVTAPTRAFLHCGLDYAGPVLVRASSGRGITSRKAYIALFVCLATRAIHLELVADYSTAAFLNAYSRFCSRRGLPQSIYSDNGTTFTGADRELACAYRASLNEPNFQNRTATDNVSWHFIPPSAPHFGGIWEAGVRSVKHHLRRVLGSHTLTFEEFSTLLCQVEACLNSRPIAPLTDSFDDYDHLTPGHFLIGTAITVSPEPSLLQLNENRLTRWQLLRQMTERFWKVWHNDYVNTLQQRSKWRRTQPSIKIGQLVLIRNSTLPPCKWELGRVVQCHPGPEGLTRVVTLKTATSELKRPIVKLCVLPVDCETNSK